MASRQNVDNPLLSTKSPESPLAIHVHPLVLLTISDYITRHTLRRQTGPVVGAVIGQQNGRSLTLEHAYECLVVNGQHELDASFFTDRLEQYKEVHKAPQLDLVALFMLGPADGPRSEHLTVLQQVQKLTGSDAVLLLLFHPEIAEQEDGKLPLSIYESTEALFVERPYDVETGEAEMIGMDFVAKGGGNANAVIGASPKEKTSRGKGRSEKEQEAKTTVLSPEDEELISSLTAKANAVKMLNERLTLLRAYLSSLSESTLTDANNTTPPPADTNFALLRNINAMLSRLPLLAAQSGLNEAVARERQDVHLSSLLAALTRSLSEAQSTGSKFHDYQRERTSKDRSFNGRPDRMMEGLQQL